MDETNALAPKVFVFDMGQVLLHFDGHEFSSLYVDSEEDAALLDAALFSSPTWSLLDAGVISEATMERVASSHLPERSSSASTTRATPATCSPTRASAGGTRRIGSRRSP